MYSCTAEDLAWAQQHMQRHISYTGWFSAMVIGCALWAALFVIAA